MSLKRYTPLRRSTVALKRTPLARSRTPIPKIRPERARTNATYGRRRAAYLEAHPWCQVTIARHGLDEATVIAQDGVSQGVRVPRSTEIHHRNKARGARKLDERWWMSAARSGHEWVENDKESARQTGFLLPFEADGEGNLPNGTRALETPQFMASRVGKIGGNEL